jgi:sulfite exporter TauE/SafE
VSGLDLLLMFTLGLVSSLHCAQMCGPIVLSYSVALGRSSELPVWGRVSGAAGPIKEAPAPRLVLNHLAYNAGRILTYCLLGAIAGLLGSSMGLLGRLTGFGGMLALITGSLMIVVGLAMFGLVPGSKFLTTRAVQFTRTVLKPCSGLIESPAAINRFFLGLGLGLLPCGILYAALIKATATASAVRGASNMLAFGLGTTASLLAIGLFSSAIRLKLNRWNAQLIASSVTVVGLLLLWRGMMASNVLARIHHGYH